jgi:WD40 repeat protein
MSNIFVSHSSLDREAAEEAHRRLHEMGHRALFLDSDEVDGIPAGQDWEHTLYLQLRACRAVVVIHSANWQASRWGFVEVAYARTLGKHIFPLLIDDRPIDGLLADRQAIDLTEEPDEGYARLERGLKRAGLDPEGSFAWTGERSPFPGLDAFDEDHAAVFFGRDEEIGDGLDPLKKVRRLGTTGLMMILGPSGSGKSSLVRAGLIPRLRRDPGSWIIVDPIRPLDDPARELSAAFARAFEEHDGDLSWEGILDQLREAQADVEVGRGGAPGVEMTSEGRAPVAYQRDSNPIVDMAHQLRIASGNQEARVIVTIDQFEELLAQANADGSARFLAVLRDAIERHHSPVFVIGTMRSDFLEPFQAHRSLVGLEYIALFIGPMAAGDIAQVIKRPAELSGIQVDDDLVQEMVADAASNDNALPLLAFTLRELHERCGDDKHLELVEYRSELGGLSGAIARTAEGIVEAARLSPQGMAELRRAFLAMVRLVEEGKYSKRVARFRDLDPKVRATLDDLRDARLLIRGEDAEGLVTYEVRHDAIFGAWVRLARWLEENHDELRLSRDLNAAAAQWIEGGKEPDRLWADARVARARELLDAGRLSLEDDTREFVETAARARERRRRRLVVVSLVVAGIMAVLAGISWAARAAADRSAQLARSRAVAARAIETVDERPDLAFLLGLEGLRLGDTREARDAMLTLRRASAAAGYIRVHESFVEDVAWDSASNTLVSVDSGGTLSLWDAAEGEQLALHAIGRRSQAVAVSAGVSRIAVGTDDGVAVWNLAVAGMLAFEAEPLLIPYDYPITAVAFDPTGRVLAAAAGDFSVSLFDAVSGERFEQSSIAHEATIWNLSFSPDGESLLTASDDGDAVVWNIATGESVVLSHDGPVRDAVFGPDGTTVATGADDHLVRVWNVADPSAAPQLLFGHTSRVRSVAFSADGEQLASGGDDQSIILWNGASPVARLVGHRGLVSAVSFGPGSQVASGGSDRTVILWEPLHADRRTLAEHAQSVRNIAFSSDGSKLTSVGEAGRVIVWNTADGSIAASREGVQGINGLALRPDNRVIATAGDDPVVRLWRAADLAPVGEFPVHTARVWSVAYSPDGRRLASSGDDGTVVIVEPASGSQTTVHQGDRAVRSVAFGGPTLLAWGDDDGNVVVWDVAAGEARQTFTDHVREVWAVAFSPDGKWLAGAGNDEVVLIWEVESGDLVARLTGATQALRDVVFGPQGEAVSAVGQDGSILIWNLDDWRLANRIDSQAGRLWTVAYHPTERTVASGGVDGAVVLWDIGLDAAVTEACRIAGRNMTLQEWEFFAGGGQYVRHCPEYPSGQGAPPDAPLAEYVALQDP